MASSLLSTTFVSPPYHPTTLPKSPVKPFFCSSSSLFEVGVRNRKIKCKAASESSQPLGSVDGTVYQGTFGPWTVDPEDVREVNI